MLPSCYDDKTHACNPIANVTAFSNTTTPIHLITFDSDKVQLYIDTCLTGGLTGFASDLIPESYNKTAATKISTDKGEANMFGQGKATCTLPNDKGDLFTINNLIPHDPQRKHRLISPQ